MSHKGGPERAARARRPRSSTDDDEERPKKKKKKRLLVDPASSSSHTVTLPAGPSRSATHQKHSLKHPPSTAPVNVSRDTAKQNRRVTMDVGEVARIREQTSGKLMNHQSGYKQTKAGGAPSSGIKVPSSLSHSQSPLPGPSRLATGARGEIYNLYRSLGRIPNLLFQRSASTQ